MTATRNPTRRTTTISPSADPRATLAFLVGAAGTALSGVLVQALVVPTTDVSDDRWSYPWEGSAYVVVSLLYVVFHLLLAVGLVAFRRSGVAGTSRSARPGIAIAITGTLALAAAEIIGLPIGDALVDDTSAQVVGAVFGLGVLLSAVGFVMAGTGTLRASVWKDWRRYTPLVVGIWSSILLVLPLAVSTALPGGVAVYGACLLAMAVALHRTTRVVDHSSPVL